MELVALATLCVGSALGLRFRVFVLLPAILVAVGIITAWQLAEGATIGSIALLNVLGTTCLQFGYLGGVVLGSLNLGSVGGTKSSTRPFPR
jgi:hypothetical protein